jgi:antagonist of KipI
MSFKVLRPGLLSTIQDLGRYGYQKYGVNVAGAMDTMAMRIGNILTGNAETEAVLEMTLTGPTLEFSSDTLIALTGADFAAVIDGVRVKLNRPIAVKAGAVLKFSSAKKGCRGYLAVAGGYNVPEVMNSKSTYLRGNLGGFKGRALKKGDLVDCGEPEAFANMLLQQLLQKGARSFRAASWFVNPCYMGKKEFDSPIRLTRGLQTEAYTESSLKALVSEPFKITTNSDRLGYRLQGAKIELKEPLEMISEIATFGTMQAPPDGNPIILMADHQSVAGYPKIGQVVWADLPRVAQHKPFSFLQFTFVDVREAENLYLAQEKYLANLKIAVLSKI